MAKILSSPHVYRGPETENLIELFISSLKKHNDKTLIVNSSTDVEWTGASIYNCIGNLCKFLIEDCQLKKGDVCSICGTEDDKVALLTLAIIVSGGSSNMLNLSDKRNGRDLHDTATAINTKIVFIKKDALVAVVPFIGSLLDKIKLVIYDEPLPELPFNFSCVSASHLFSSNVLFDKAYDWETKVRSIKIVPEDDLAVIMFSSGTTGKPKPIPRTHKNIAHLIAAPHNAEFLELKPGDVVSGVLTINFRPGFWILTSSIVYGCKFILWDSSRCTETLVAAMDKYKVTILSTSLPLLTALGGLGKETISKYDLSSLEECITSGSKIVSDNLPLRIIELFKLKCLRQCFGMTESGLICLMEKSFAHNNYLKVGHVLPGMQLKIVNRENNVMLASNTSGEVAIKSDQIFPGYLTGDKENRVYNRSDFDSDGFFRTGDKAFYDDDGLICIEGRYKEMMILRNDEMFMPTEVETLIFQHKSVQDVCVVKVGEGKADYVYDLARAYVILKSNCLLTKEELKKFIEDNSAVLLDGGIEFVKSFPRLANGKVDKKSLASL